MRANKVDFLRCIHLDTTNILLALKKLYLDKPFLLKNMENFFSCHICSTLDLNMNNMCIKN
jgi:hypothetical protein